MAGKGSSAAKKPKDIDSYIAAQPIQNRELLTGIRKAVREMVPEATEAFVYGVPGFKLGGKPLVCYAGFKNHCGFYPMDPDVIRALADELTEFQTSEGTVKFTPSRPLPRALIGKLVEARVAGLQG